MIMVYILDATFTIGGQHVPSSKDYNVIQQCPVSIAKVLRNTNYGHCGICESLHVVGNLSASLMVYYFAWFTQTKYEHMW